MDRCQREFGPTFTVRLLAFSEIVYVSRPETIKRVMSAPGSTLLTGKARQGMSMLKTMLGTTSLLMVDEAPHKRLRKLLAPPLHGERMKAYADTIREETLQEIRNWPMGPAIDMRTSMARVTLNVILRCVYGVESAERLDTISSYIQQVLTVPSAFWHIRALQSPWLPSNPYVKMLETKKRLDDLIYDMIRERRAGHPEAREDILSLLLTTKDEAGEPMTDLEVRDNLWGLLTAGHETSSTTLCWALERLLAHPEAMRKAREEIARVAGDEPMSAAHVPELKYVSAVLDETLRQRPSFQVVMRLVEEPLELEGYTLRPGTFVAPCIYLSHKNPDVFPEPNAFRPERFLESTPTPNTYFPFGGGVRRCTGAAFSLYEMKLILATMLQRLRFRANSPIPAVPERRTGVLAPKGGPSIIVERAISRA